MRLYEILAEVSRNEAERRRRLSAQSRRAQSNSPVDPSVRQKGIPANVPPRSHYATGAPLKKQQDIPGAFAGNEFDEYRYGNDPTESKGVVLRFKIIKDKDDKDIVYGYWAHDYAVDWQDAKNFGTILPIGELYSETTIDLINKLIKEEHNVNVFFDSEIKNAQPKSVRALMKWINTTGQSRFGGSLNLDTESTPIASRTPVPVVNVPRAAPNISNQNVLSARIMNTVRQNPELHEKYKNASPDARTKALNASIVELNKTKDIDSAIDMIDDQL